MSDVSPQPANDRHELTGIEPELISMKWKDFWQWRKGNWWFIVGFIVIVLLAFLFWPHAKPAPVVVVPLGPTFTIASGGDSIIRHMTGDVSVTDRNIAGMKLADENGLPLCMSELGVPGTQSVTLDYAARYAGVSDQWQITSPVYPGDRVINGRLFAGPGTPPIATRHC